MRRIASSAPALAVIIGLALAISPASAQQVTSTGAIFGQNWNMGQDFQSMGAMGSPLPRPLGPRRAPGQLQPELCRCADPNGFHPEALIDRNNHR